ncbi:MAG: type IV pilin [Halobacteriales archaeon]
MDLSHIKQLLDHSDNRAVSPVIGVILMVAITVILAAVVGSFILGVGSGIQATPQASFSFDYTQQTNAETDSLELSHGGGDKISASTMAASIDDAYNNTVGNTNGVSGKVDIFTSVDQVGAGDSDTITNTTVLDNPSNNDLLLNESTVRITFEETDGSNTAILAKWDGPDA